MRDPVIGSDGITYERAAIEAWFATGATTSPLTRAPMGPHTLVPNIALRSLIQEGAAASDGRHHYPTARNRPMRSSDSVASSSLPEVVRLIDTLADAAGSRAKYPAASALFSFVLRHPDNISELGDDAEIIRAKCHEFFRDPLTTTKILASIGAILYKFWPTDYLEIVESVPIPEWAHVAKLFSYVLRHPDIIAEVPEFAFMIRAKCREMCMEPRLTRALLASTGAVMHKFWPDDYNERYERLTVPHEIVAVKRKALHDALAECYSPEGREALERMLMAEQREFRAVLKNESHKVTRRIRDMIPTKNFAAAFYY